MSTPVLPRERQLEAWVRFLRAHAALTRELSAELAACDTDRRVVYAQLTEAGEQKLREASGTHLAGIHQLFTSRFGEDELGTLSSLLGRLPGASVDGDDCAPQ